MKDGLIALAEGPIEPGQALGRRLGGLARSDVMHANDDPFNQTFRADPGPVGHLSPAGLSASSWKLYLIDDSLPSEARLQLWSDLLKVIPIHDVLDRVSDHRIGSRLPGFQIGRIRRAIDQTSIQIRKSIRTPRDHPQEKLRIAAAAKGLIGSHR
jgi:hypothetical protein